MSRQEIIKKQKKETQFEKQVVISSKNFNEKNYKLLLRHGILRSANIMCLDIYYFNLYHYACVIKIKL